MNISTLPALLQRFFTDRLTAQLQASPNTVAGYRDTFRLLLRFASQRRDKPPTKLRIDDIDAALIGDFLTHVEKVRRNSARSRNTRLAAIRSFYRYVAMNEPELRFIASAFSPCRTNATSAGRWTSSTGR